MYSKRWRRMEELFHAALALEPDSQRTFLDNACGPDLELRREVEYLLAGDEKTASFLESEEAELETSQAAPALPGQQLGPYRILAPLGAGGMGEVYRAHDCKLDREVALKFLPSAFAGDPEWLERFRREARTLASLNHPNIAMIYGLEEFDEATCLVLELVEGETLRGPLPVEPALEYVRQVAEALEGAHAKGIIHRDLKPANIKVTPEGRVKVLDFGLAKAISGMDEKLDLSRQKTVIALESVAGQIAGTPPYMSPEQVRGEMLDGRTDLWSLGVVLYEVCAGAKPFEAGSFDRILETILTSDPVPLRRRSPKVPAELERIVGKLLQKDRERRYRSAAELLRDVRKLQARQAAAPRKYWMGAAAALVVAGAGALLWQRFQSKPLTDKDVLVLADFTNTTGEPIFDGALREALAIQIEESPFLKTLSDERVRIDLRLMGRPLSERITNDIAREICQRENQKAMIGGSIAALGKTYVVTLESANCRTGDTLARAQAEAPDREHVLAAVAQAAKGMRRKLGESLSSIQRLEPTRQTDEVTTTSLPAFQAFAQSLSLFRQGAYLDAIPVMRRATELDPNFAMAWAQLSTLYLNMNGAREGDHYAEYSARAFELRNRTTEAERFPINSGYYLSRQEWDKAIENNVLWTRTYPRNHRAHAALGYSHWLLGELEEALREQLEGYRLEPRNSVGHGMLIWVYKDLDRFDEAKKIAAAELAQNPDDVFLRELLLLMAFIQRDETVAGRQMEWFRGKSMEFLGLRFEVVGAKLLGQLRRANEINRQVIEMQQRHGLPSTPALSAGEPPLMGNCPATFPPRMGSSIALWRESDLAAVALALCGDSAQAAKALKRGQEALAQRPDNTLLKAIQLPMLRATAELKRGQPDNAIELLQPVMHYERRYPEVVYLRGLVYLQARKGTEAAGEFQKIIDHKGTYWGPFYAVSYVGLARGATLAGDITRAKRAYQDFLALWKDADADIPILIAARKEYAALN
jgi:tetratricopeptide (TPR) repeat protein